MELSTLIEGKYLPAGNHTLSFVYGGNAKYDVSNTTAILEINKITPVILLNVTGLGYNLIVNVTVMDGEYGIADATGNVTIQVAGRTATIYLGNSQGMTIIYGVPIGNYTVNATYNGDNNYYPVTNSTDANVTEKTQTVLIIDLDNEKTYFINETVPIKVTILPNAEGNITLYINGVPHVLPLEHEGNSTFVNFNATELIDGVNYVFATYDGTELYAPSWAQDSFNVTKYNATIGIDAADITYGDTEVINITLPEDATGILNVTVNGTSYYVEIINGTASLPVSNLGVGEYNVTVRFNEDKKYYNATNSRLFKVNKATPSLNITVENITYGENATVVVTLPDGVSGNVTIKLGEDIVFTEAPIDGQATFTLKDLPASNYTIEATFNGNENYTVVSNSTNFTVFKATPIVNVTVEDIYYGDAEHIIIKVNTEGNVTVKVNGAETVLNVTSQGNETYVYDLAVGSYPVEVTFNGNENYTNLTVTKEFNVYPVNTTLDVQVHDILVWDKESINVTLADNATGNVIININGENHTVPIVNGTAQLNLGKCYLEGKGIEKNENTALKWLKKAAEQNKAQIYIFNKHFKAKNVSYNWKNFTQKISYCGITKDLVLNFGLLGKAQVYNLATVLSICEILKDKLPKINFKTIKKTCKNVKFAARFDYRKVKINNKRCSFIIDGAHNIQATENFLYLYKKSPFYSKKTKLLFAVMQEKDFKSVIKSVAKEFGNINLLKIENSRAVNINILKEEFSKYTDEKNINCYDCKEDFFNDIKNNDVYICTGSFYLAGTILKFTEETNG